MPKKQKPTCPRDPMDPIQPLPPELETLLRGTTAELEALLAAIFKVWKADVSGTDPELREHALAWVHSEACHPLCELANIDPEMAFR